jgi:hypothetical protein
LEAAHVTYGIIADYKGFKEGIVELCKDAREFGADVCGAITKNSGASDHQIFRIEKRSKTPGRIRRLIDKLEDLNEIEGQLSKSELARLLERVRRDLELLEKDLSPDEIKTLHQALRFENLPPLKEMPRRRSRPEAQRTVIRSDNEEGYLPLTTTAVTKLTPHPYLSIPLPETKISEPVVYQKSTFVPVAKEGHQAYVVPHKPIQDLFTK